MLFSPEKSFFSRKCLDIPNSPNCFIFHFFLEKFSFVPKKSFFASQIKKLFSKFWGDFLVKFPTWTEIKFKISPEKCLLILFSHGKLSKKDRFFTRKEFQEEILNYKTVSGKNMSDFCSCWKPSKELHKKNNFQEKKHSFWKKPPYFFRKK